MCIALVVFGLAAIGEKNRSWKERVLYLLKWLVAALVIAGIDAVILQITGTKLVVSPHP
jgi:hypothetical protein